MGASRCGLLLGLLLYPEIGDEVVVFLPQKPDSGPVQRQGGRQYRGLAAGIPLLLFAGDTGHHGIGQVVIAGADLLDLGSVGNSHRHLLVAGMGEECIADADDVGGKLKVGQIEEAQVEDADRVDYRLQGNLQIGL